MLDRAEAAYVAIDGDIIGRVGDDTQGFEAALITDECKSAGAIFVARDRSRQRRRFS